MSEAAGSRIPGFHNLPVDERQAVIASFAALDEAERALLLSESPLSLEAAARLTENTVGVYALPMGLALNFIVNGRDVLVPMVTEEPSVIAAASNAARLARPAGGFTAEADPPCMIAQVQLVSVPDPVGAQKRLEAASERICARVDELAPGMARRGGGARGIEVRVLDSPDGQQFVVVHLLVDVGDAMGANAINTIAEQTAPLLAEISGGLPHLRILSNLTDRRCGRASVRYRFGDLAMKERSGEEVARGVELASLFAEADPYRATTHNKGIMNGIDAVALAMGQDWRAIEAGAHAWASKDHRYRSLSTWKVDEDHLLGTLELPLAVGIVGGSILSNPTVRANLAMTGITSARELSEIMVAVGLAQNLGALRALATEGIQRGHMRMHARNVATAAGASTEQVPLVAEKLFEAGDYSLARAKQVLQELASP